MSKYTTELRFICENNASLTESKGFNDIDEIIKTSAPKIFNFNFPIFDEDYRLPLEVKILRTFYTREICEETVGLWKLRLQNKLCNIMPYYNQLYKSALLEFNPFYDTDITREHSKKGETDTSSDYKNTDKTTGSETGEQKYNNVKDTTVHGKKVTYTPHNYTVDNDVLEKMSDTPQGTVDNLRDEKYLTSAKITSTKNKQSGSYDNANTGTDTNTKSGNITNNVSRTNTTTNNSTNNTHIDDTEKYLETVTGKQGTVSYSKLLKEYRDTFLNIDKMILEELTPLFFNLW